jgi:hypothetical protein
MSGIEILMSILGISKSGIGISKLIIEILELIMGYTEQNTKPVIDATLSLSYKDSSASVFFVLFKPVFLNFFSDGFAG